MATADGGVSPARRAAALLAGDGGSANGPGNPRRGVLDGIPGKVRVTGGRLHLGVTKEFPDDGEALAQG